ncbi:hypothetical protein [Rufibacter roseus]|uniref:STAS/SEC14 domain-containing protein n=1 Tax=Rufibacter roseus TaxID=1567108 RepID=A0ABW2DNB5_9BACT|nr:hypothetical protein [Rufibacter roseus]
MEYFKSNLITIEYDEDKKLARTKWHGFANSEEYREILGIYLQLVREKDVVRWIGNNTDAKAIRPADQEWTAREWAPVFSREGKVRKMAVVVAKDIFNKMAVENLVARSNDVIKFVTHFFPDEQNAYEWVMSEEA